MTCSWCEEENEIIKLCNIEDHRVCKICYDKYREMYPTREEGCPYCKGNKENFVEVMEIHAPETETIIVISNPPYTETSCDTNVISTTILFLFIVLLFLFCITKSFRLF
tara:strand:- start:34 stop:360 length:327 start_codon:yes stop_codon:yes gene_type:complete